MINKQSKRTPNLLWMLIALTAIFILAQLTFFAMHYQVAELLDTIVQQSMAEQLGSVAIALPVLSFIFIQLLCYGLLVYAVWFVSQSVAAIFRAPRYASGIVIYLLTLTAILTLNHYCCPESFFAQLLDGHFVSAAWIDRIAWLSTGCLLLCITFAYVHVWRSGQYRRSAWVFISLMIIMTAPYLIDKCYVWFKQKPQFHRQPNIILIGLDSLRPDYTGFFGAQQLKTPHISHFLATGSTVTEAYTPLARTFPAWASILTAQYPRHNHARNNLANPMPVLQRETLAHHLQQAGYETIYATDEKRFSNVTEDYGFDRVIGPKMGLGDFIVGGLADFPLSNLLINLPIGRIIFPFNYANRAASITYAPDRFLHLIKLGLAGRPDKPLFLAVHFCLSHWPFTWAHAGHASDPWQAQQYQSSVAAVDLQMGRLLADLKRAGILQHALVVLLSDHGTTLGLPGDRFIDKSHYMGDAKKIKQVSVYKLSSAPGSDPAKRNDYALNTCYGQGTDVLSLKQYHVLLAFKGYGVSVPTQRIAGRHMLMDIAPTLLDYLHLAPFSQPIDGQSLVPYLSQATTISADNAPIFIETGDTIGEIETDHINVQNVVRQRLGAYQIDASTGLLTLRDDAERSIIHNKQRAILLGDWLLAKYPRERRVRLVPSKTIANRLEPDYYTSQPYYILANLKTGAWTVDLKDPWAQHAPIAQLKQQLMQFYGEEMIASHDGTRR